MAYGKSDFNDYLISPFACISQPTAELGVKAVEQLLKEINEDVESPVLIELPGTIST
jgi:DNA-binding LacI/PurR family transcriptional regulator